MFMMPEAVIPRNDQEDRRPSINNVPDPRIPPHRPLPQLIRPSQIQALRTRLDVEAGEIDAELERFPGHPRLLSAKAAVNGDLGRLGALGSLSEKAAGAERHALEAQARLTVASDAAAAIEKALTDKVAAADVVAKRRGELVEQLGALSVDGGDTKRLQRELEQLDAEALVTQAAVGTLRQRVVDALAARDRASDDASSAARAAESVRLQSRDEELRAAVIAASDLLRGVSPTTAESARMKFWLDVEIRTLLY